MLLDYVMLGDKGRLEVEGKQAIPSVGLCDTRSGRVSFAPFIAPPAQPTERAKQEQRMDLQSTVSRATPFHPETA